MSATIANCAMVPPKLIPGVSRNAGGYSGKQRQQHESDHAEQPLLGPAQAHAPRCPQHISGRQQSVIRSATLMLMPAPSRGLTENAGGPDQQHQNQHHERHHVAPLGAEHRLPVVLDHTEQQTTQQRAPQIADTTEHRGRKSLDAKEESARIDDALRHLQHVQQAPPTPASNPPIRKVLMMTRSRETPIRVAVVGSWATARIPRPNLVRLIADVGQRAPRPTRRRR